MSGTDEPVPLRSDTLGTLRERGLAVPAHDRTRLVPRIVHIGVGGFHRAHLAAYCHDLAAGGGDWGICGIGLLDSDRAMADALGHQDHLYTLTTRHDDTSRTAVVGSIVDYVLADPDTAAATERIARPTTAIVSLTVTEAGDDDRGRNRQWGRCAGSGWRRRDSPIGGGSSLMLRRRCAPARAPTRRRGRSPPASCRPRRLADRRRGTARGPAPSPPSGRRRRRTSTTRRRVP